MTKVDYYELVRQKLRAGTHSVPKHRKVIEFYKVLWSEEDARLLSFLDPIGTLNSAQEIAERSGDDAKKVEAALAPLAEKGTIIHSGNKFGLLPLIPGTFELYFLKRNDTEENLKKAAVLWEEIMHTVLPSVMISSNQPFLQPKLPFKKHIVEIDETIEADSQILPHELVEEMIHRNDYFAKAVCQCRLAGEYAGNPCKVAPPDVGCFAVGDVAKLAVASGVAEEITKEGAIDYLKRAEKAGLVHNGLNVSGPAKHFLICNCCPCHCPALYPEAEYGLPSIKPGNFIPSVHHDLCVKCETCIEKCPVKALFHRWPVAADSSDEKIILKEDMCIGCGLCAINCPENAMKMVRIREHVEPEPSPLMKAFGME